MCAYMCPYMCAYMCAYMCPYMCAYIPQVTAAKDAALKAQHDALMQANLAKQQLHSVIGGTQDITNQVCRIIIHICHIIIHIGRWWHAGHY